MIHAALTRSAHPAGGAACGSVTARMSSSRSASTASWKSVPSSGHEWPSGVGPAKGFGGAVEVVDKGQDLRTQVARRGETAALDHPTHQNTQPNLDLIEP